MLWNCKTDRIGLWLLLLRESWTGGVTENRCISKLHTIPWQNWNSYVCFWLARFFPKLAHLTMLSYCQLTSTACFSWGLTQLADELTLVKKVQTKWNLVYVNSIKNPLRSIALSRAYRNIQWKYNTFFHMWREESWELYGEDKVCFVLLS